MNRVTPVHRWRLLTRIADVHVVAGRLYDAIGPISLISGVHPHPPGVDPALVALMRQPYTLLALIHFLTNLMHFDASPSHAWVRRAGVFWSRVPER
jgi:hypothetical protein